MSILPCLRQREREREQQMCEIEGVTLGHLFTPLIAISTLNVIVRYKLDWYNLGQG